MSRPSFAYVYFIDDIPFYVLYTYFTDSNTIIRY